jgi:hypothetical protein
MATMAVLALGVSVHWARSGPADFTPLLAMIGAILILRFVIGVPLTLLRTLAGAAAGAAWAAAGATLGFAIPTLAALAAIAVLALAVGRTRSS